MFRKGLLPSESGGLRRKRRGIAAGNSGNSTQKWPHGLTVAEVERWKERFLSGAENALRNRPRDEEEEWKPADRARGEPGTV